MYSVKVYSREDTKIRVIWLHGWGASSTTMLPLAELFKNQTENYLFDLMGFGKSPALKRAYSSEDYADDVAEFMKKLPQKKTLVIGHSNGARIAINLAVKYPELVNSLVLIAGAGIPIPHSIFFRAYSWTISTFSPIVKKVFPFLKNVSLSSADYRNSQGIMRETFLKSLHEDTRTLASRIKIPTLLIYGDMDTATPVYVGKEYNKIIFNSILKIVEGADHWGLLLGFKQQTHHYITTFIREKL